MNHNNLNRKIYPIFGEYQESKSKLKPYEQLKLWSKMGSHIDKYLIDNKISSKSKLFRELYGRSEGSDENIRVIGYISREFLQRAHRVYLMEKNGYLNIDKNLKNLNSTGVFRESMPFIGNQKYRFKGKKLEELFSLLNSNKSSKIILNEIRILQKKYINISNPRTQRLDDLKEQKLTFIKCYNNIYKSIKENSFNKFSEEDTNNVKLLSSYFTCLTSDEFNLPNKELNSFVNEDLECLRSVIVVLFKDKNAKIRRRFRKLIPIKRIKLISKYIFICSSKDLFINFDRN